MSILIIGDILDHDAGGGIPDQGHHRRVPFSVQINVARHIHCTQGRAQRRVIPNQVCVNLLPCAPPDTLGAIIGFQSALQRNGGNPLHFGINRGTHGHPTAEKLILTKMTAKLTADFICKVIPWRQRGLKAFEIPVLHGQQGHVPFGQILILWQVSVLPHLAQHVIAPLQQTILAAHRVKIRGRLGKGRQKRGLMRGQLPKRFVEIGLCRRRHTIRVLTQENFVEIKFKDLFLIQGFLDPGRKDNFLDLAFGTARSIQQKVFHHLLGNGRGAAHIAPTRHGRIAKGGCNPADIIARMGVEIFILCRNKRLFDHHRNFLGRGEQTTFLGEFIYDAPLGRINAADGWGFILRQ